MKKIQKNDGFTLIELLIVVAIIGIIAAIAVPGLLRARMSGNEASAIGSLRAINTAQQNFSQFCNGFGDTLPDLAFTPPGSNQPYLSPDMTNAATINKSGYSTRITNSVNPAGAAVANTQCAAVTPQTGYYAAAWAVTMGTTGTRGFASDMAGTIWQDVSGTQGTVPVQPFAIAGTVSPIQ